MSRWLLWGVVVCAPAVAEAVSGRVYDAKTARYVQGARLTVFYDETDAEAPGQMVPPEQLPAGQQGQTTPADGRYVLDLPPGRSYRLGIEPPPSYAFPSQLIPPTPGFAPAGAVVPQPQPTLAPDARRTYYLRFDRSDVTNNHIPLDPSTALLVVAHKADRPAAGSGDVIGFRIDVANRSDRSLSGVVVRARLDRKLVAVGAASDEVRFGPADLAAGASLAFQYRAVVVADAPPGTYRSMAVALDAGGAPVSNEAAATVRVDSDPVFDEGLVLGRVFCDDDGDGRLGPGEHGVFGARVALETGNYARTDSTGKYHLGRIEPGVHVVKLDENSLPPGAAAPIDAQVIYFTRGLPARVSFGVRCVPLPVTTLAVPEGSIRLSRLRSLVPPKTTVRLAGDLAAMTAGFDGKAIPLVAVDVALHAPESLLLPAAAGSVGPNLRPPGVSGYETKVTFRPSVAGDAPVRTWTLTLARNQGRLLKSFRGEGAPVEVEWDGLDKDGKPIGPDELVVYQLQVEGRGGVQAASARKSFGVAFGAAPPSERTETWRGDFFTGDRRPRATEVLAQRIQALVKSLGPGDEIVLEVHDGGAGDALAASARTQRQAEAARNLFIDAGLPARRIRARGRGALAALAPPTTEAARTRNRRVTVRVVSPIAAVPGLSIPSPAPVPAEARLGTEALSVDAQGRFARDLPIPAAGQATLQLTAPDGRRVAQRVDLGRERGGSRRVRVAGDLRRGSLIVDGQPFDAWLLAVDVGMIGDDVRPAFEPVIPPMIEVSAWEIAVWRATAPPPAEPIWRTGGKGTPAATIEWNRAAAAPGDSFLVRLSVEDVRGGWGASPLRSLRIPAVKEVVTPGPLFTAAGEPTARLRERLAALAATLAQRPPERTRLQVRAELPGLNAPERRLALAARAGKVKQILVRLGIPPDRLVVSSAEGPDGLAVLSEPLPAPVRARATIDGKDAQLYGSTFDVVVDGPPDTAVVVEVLMSDGHQATWAIGGGARPAPAPLPPAPLPAAARRIVDATTGRPIPVAADVAAAQLEVRLPPRNAELRSTDLWLNGKTAPGNQLRAGGTEVPVREDGGFDAVVPLPMGKSTLVIETQDPRGNMGRLEWPVAVSDSAHFLVAIADGAIANTRLDGMTGDTVATAGDAVFHGRLAAFYQGRFSGGNWFRQIDVTAQVDTAREGAFEPFFRLVIDPARDFVFGDSSTEVAGANSRGKVFARIEADQSSAVLGSFQSNLREGLFSYDRTLQGVDVEFRRSFGALDQEIKVFGATSDARVARDVNVFRTTGGTLYYLRNKHVVEGGEQVRLIVRDGVSGLPLFERSLERNGDYLIDYPGGRVQLKAPVASFTDARSVITNLAATQTPLGGNPVYLEVSYEYETEGTGTGAAGLYVKEKVGSFAVGGGVVGEFRDEEESYTLAGADITFAPSAQTRLRLEVAASRAVEAASFLSQDGGLRFQGLSAVGEQAATGDTQLGWKVDFRSRLAEVVDAEWARRTDLSLYAQSLDRGFSAGSSVLEQGRTKFGGEVRSRVTDRDTLTLRHDTQLADLPRVGPTPATVNGLDDPLELDHAGAYLTSLAWARTGQTIDFTLQAAHQRLGSTAQDLRADRFGVGGLVGWKLSRRLTLRLGQEVQVSGSDRDPVLHPIDPSMPAVRDNNALAGVATSAGADVLLAPGLLVSATGIVRWNGDTGATAGLKTPIDENASMYLQQRFESRSSRLVSTSVVGGEERFAGGTGGRAYGEYQIESGVLGARNRAVMGVGHRFAVAPGVRMAAGFEHQETRGGYLPDGTPTGDSRRDVISVGVEYVRPARVKAAAVVEARFDRGVADIDPSFGPLVESDTRRTSPPGTYPDHGGVAPGAPLAILPGESKQLVGRAACDFLVAANHSFLLRLNAADTRAEGESLARFVEATAGWAFRPIRFDWLDVLLKYSFLYDRRPGETIGESSHVLALAPIVDVGWQLRLSGKLAWKRSEVETATDSVLGLLRLGRMFGKRWDVAAEYRILHVGREGGAELRHGALIEVAFFLDKRIRLAAGYNFTHFSDDEMADLDDDTHGVYFRVVGRY